MKQKLGILGGTFNPVHIGHLWMARDALEQLGLARVTFVPCAIPPHKDAPDLASARDRLAMLRAAVRGEPDFAVDDIEIRRGAPSYTVETLTELHRQLPRTDFYFIIGGDSLGELPCWKEINRLAQLCTFVVVTRPGYSLPAAPANVNCVFVHGHTCEVASSDLRARLRAGRSIRYLVPDAVLRYIRRRNLYNKGKKSSKHVR